MFSNDYNRLVCDGEECMNEIVLPVEDQTKRRNRKKRLLINMADRSHWKARAKEQTTFFCIKCQLPGSIKNVTEMFYPDQDLYGYMFRIRRDLRRYRKFFPVSEYNWNWMETRESAREYRDEWLDEWEKYCAGKNETIKYQQTNTGLPGISLNLSGPKPVLIANYRLDGKPKTKQWYLPHEDAPEYESAYEEALEQAWTFIDAYNYKRFGGRWGFYKQEKQLIEV